MNDIDIASAATLQPITKIAAKLGIDESALENYGRYKAKIDRNKLSSGNGRGRLILVTAITPTPAGEGKTTTTVGLGDALTRLGTKTAICLREPSLGPCFGMKGGAAGGGYAQVLPMADINLHFTGDFHAISVAHNLLSAMIDNHLYWGNELGLDSRRISWRRVVDMNDRALRDVVVGLGGPGNGYPRQSGYDITVASEVMAILCLARDLNDLKRRLGNIVIGSRQDLTPVRAADLGAAGAMTVLLRDAFKPNLVQTIEATPAFIHGGPFANIAHGCNSVAATDMALDLADYVVTEAGFGADLGAEKFFNIKCRKANLTPSVAVLVATVRALKMHGGVSRDDLAKPNLAALEKGLANLGRHLRNIALFGVPAVVAINRFSHDRADEIALIADYCASYGVTAHECTHWADGGAGALALARDVKHQADSNAAQFRVLYEDSMPLFEKVQTIARKVYDADNIVADARVRAQFKHLHDQGFGALPICIAKTQYSFSTDPNLKGAPSGHVVAIRDVRLAAGAEFCVALCGDIMTMPGLPKVSAATAIDIDDAGQIIGLF